MLIWFEDIQSRPAELLKEIYQFLAVEPDFIPPRVHQKSNAARSNRIPWLQKCIQRMNGLLVQWGLSGFLRRIKNAGLGHIVSQINSRPLEKDKVTAEMKAYILHQLTVEITELEKLTGRDLSHWKQ